MCVIADKLVGQGEERGMQLLNSLTVKLAEDGREADIVKAAMDSEYQKQLLAEYGLA